MNTIHQEAFDSQKAVLDGMIAVQNSFFEGFEKLVDLNLKIARASLEDAAQRMQKALEIRDPQETVAFAAGLAQPDVEKALAYGRQVGDIISNLRADLTRLSEEHIARHRKEVGEAIERLSEKAPAGCENAVALMKSSLSTAANAYEAATKAAKQASETIESNINAATDATLKAASAAADAGKPATRARRAPAQS
ncbi:MAG: phasin family protein [Candidimonas sp.]|nr:MAG: phasin family protein [Candidimonas sp.]